jgi:hypothetical protein
MIVCLITIFHVKKKKKKRKQKILLLLLLLLLLLISTLYVNLNCIEYSVNMADGRDVIRRRETLLPIGDSHVTSILCCCCE